MIDASQWATDTDAMALPFGDASTLAPNVDPGDAHDPARDQVRWHYYSSGTTATAKGAKHTDRSGMAASNAHIAYHGLQEDDLFPVPFPIAHIGGLMVQCEVYHQDFLAMKLPESRFDGIFANASLFHVPSQELPRVLLELLKTLKPRGMLFSSNPRGNNEEGLSDGRYACFFDFDTWRDYVTSAGFVEVDHYYRPPGRPRHQQPWLATVWRKG